MFAFHSDTHDITVFVTFSVKEYRLNEKHFIVCNIYYTIHSAMISTVRQVISYGYGFSGYKTASCFKTNHHSVLVCCTENYPEK